MRLSEFGYSNRTVGGISVGYSSLDDYVTGLRRATDTPHPPYQRIGVKQDGQYRQLNANLLQIENEYYSYVRPSGRRLAMRSARQRWQSEASNTSNCALWT